MADRETLRRRQDLLRARLRKPGIRLSMSEPGQELSGGGAGAGRRGDGRGDRGGLEEGRPVRLLDGAVPGRRLGRGASGSRALRPESLATAPLARDAPLPWDVVDGVPDRDFLWAEWEKASRGETTGDCRWDGCGDCGACEEPPGNELAGAHGRRRGAAAAVAAMPRARSRRTPRCRRPGGPPAAAPTCWRYVARFSVTGRGRFLGHLDRMEAFRRAVRRAGGRLALSAGMRPKPLLSLALPLGVGVEGLEELCEFELAEEPAAGFAERLAAALPGHMRLLDLRALRRSAGGWPPG